MFLISSGNWDANKVWKQPGGRHFLLSWIFFCCCCQEIAFHFCSALCFCSWLLSSGFSSKTVKSYLAQPGLIPSTSEFRPIALWFLAHHSPKALYQFHSVPWKDTQFSSVTQSCLTLCDTVGCSMPGFPVHHQLPELTHTHVHWVSDTIQPSHPLSSPSPPTFNLSQHQGLFQWVNSWYQMAKVLVSASTSVLPVNTQDWFPLGWGVSLCSPRTLKSLLQHHSSKAS